MTEFRAQLGCGTALPSLAMFQTIASLASGADRAPISFTLADYNPNVLHLVTLPNMILGWALCQSDNASMKAALETDGELELTSELKDQFLQFLSTRRITLSFLSGGWSEEFVNKLYASGGGLWDDKDASTILLGSETIYSPFALEAFTVTVFSVLCRQMELDCKAELFVAAKRLYFGVGGSLDDFVVKARNLGARVDTMREETEGVRRGVVRCYFET